MEQGRRRNIWAHSPAMDPLQNVLLDEIGGIVEEPIIEILSESENFSLWRAEEPDGETTYHLELGAVTVHFFREEWEEFLSLMRGVGYAAAG